MVELREHLQIAAVEVADIFDAVAHHGKAGEAETKREAGVFIGVDAAGAQHVRVNHTARAKLNPTGTVAGGAALAAADVPVYDSTLYEGGASLSTADNILRVGRELGLCSDDADTNALVTRGDAAIILHVVLTQSFRIEEPPVPVTLVNAAGVNVNDFLLELRKLPEQVLDAFNAAGWTYCIDFDYMGGLSKKLNMSCIGATNYSQKTIYLSEASATLHEFGHFLDWMLGFPAEYEQLYLAEAQNSGLRDYAKTNAREYFADCFAYCIIHGNDSEMMESLRKNAPQTCTYFEELGKGSRSRSIRSK